MIKSFFILIVIAIVGAGLYARQRMSKTLEQVYPYPYVIKPFTPEGLEEAQKAQILIVGDRFGKSFDSYLPKIIEETSRELKSPLKVFNWSTDGETLLRSLYKIKSLKKFPELLIYLGGTQEYYESRFKISETPIIKHNIKQYQNEALASLILLFPKLSHFIYEPLKYTLIKNTPKVDDFNLTASDQQKKMELNFQLQKFELDDLFNFIQDKSLQSLFVIPPLNLDLTPVKTCRNTTTDELKVQQQKLKKMINKGNLKVALPIAKKIESVSLGNSLSSYLLGQTYKKMGNPPLAIENLKKAIIFDCVPNRAHPIFNIILKEKARAREVNIIDFDQQLNIDLGRNVLFMDIFSLQHIYYQKLQSQILQRIKQILDLK